MKLEYLAAHGFSSRTLDVWAARYTTELLPLQAQVISGSDLLRGGNVVVFAPTSSGKTFVAELAAMRHIEQGRKAVFLVPTKALAEEQFARFCGIYGPAGIRVALATRERTEHDAHLVRGDFDLAVMVYEKLKGFLAIAPELLRQVGCVIVDELQILGEPERGPQVDLLLTKLVRCGANVQVVALSAVLGENARLAAYLESDCFIWRERPVELREGAWSSDDAMYHYREVNSRREGEELLGAGRIAETNTGYERAGGIDEAYFAAAALLVRELVAERGEQALVFVPTRHSSREWARRIAEELGLEDRSVAEELKNFEAGRSRESLEECFVRGVGFHNSDMSHELRGLTERLFREHRLKVLVATSTLAQGVNLTCRNVLSVPVMLVNDAFTNAPLYVPLTVQRFRNQGGRAGRFGQVEADAFGRSILLARDAVERDRLGRSHVHADVEPLDAPIAEAHIDMLVLDLVHSKLGRDLEQVVEMLSATYSGMTRWSGEMHRLRMLVERAIERLMEAELILKRRQKLESTGLGQAACSYGIQVSTAELFTRYVREANNRPPTDFELLALCAFSDDGALFPFPVWPGEAAQQLYPRRLAARGELHIEQMPAAVRELLAPAAGYTDEAQAALKKSFVAEAWIGEHPTREIEEHFNTHSGVVANLAGHFAWLMQALAGCAGALGASRAFCANVQEVAVRLPDGVTAEGVALSRLRVANLTRNYIAALLREGYNSAESLRNVQAIELVRIIPLSVAEALLASCAHSKPAACAHSAERTSSSAPPDTILLEIDEDNIGFVHFCGERIELKPLQFRLLLLLAESPQRLVKYERISEVIWPDVQVEQQQVSAHKQAIIRAFAKVCGDADARRILQAKSGRGLYLDLAPAQISVLSAHASATKT